MDNLHYEFGGNSGYKIHLPVVPDANDPLTKRIIQYLDSIYGTTEADRYQRYTNELGQTEYYSEYFKVGKVEDAFTSGKGMTIYGKESTADEMRKLAQDIEAKFGREIQAVKTKYNINHPNTDVPITSIVSGRFNTCVSKGNNGHDISLCGYSGVGHSNYNHVHNPSGAPTVIEYKDIYGKLHDSEFDAFNWKSLSDIDKKFLWGDSTMETIDHYGELFTGKIENGKVPQFIMDGLPKEYLQHYHLTEKDIILRINKGTKLFVANMLEDMVNTPDSAAFRKVQWMTTLDPNLIDEAKQLLAQHEPETFKKLERMLPQLEKQCPSLSILRHNSSLWSSIYRRREYPKSVYSHRASEPLKMNIADIDSLFSESTSEIGKSKITKPSTPLLLGDIIEETLPHNQTKILHNSIRMKSPVTKAISTVFSHTRI